MLKRFLRTQRVSRGIIETLKSSALGGILLILITIIALVLANSDWKDSYHHLWEIPVGFTFGDFTFNMHLLHWVNGGLGAIMVIAIFYTSELNFQYLLTGLGLLAFIWVLNMFRFRKIPVIHIVGIIV